MIYYTNDGCYYEGMDQDTIIALRAELGRATQFVDKATYDAYIVAHQK